MTPLALWTAVALIALVATAFWAFFARETGVYISAGISWTAWAWIAITGGDVALANSGNPIWVRETTASIQFIAIAMAVISLVVIVMRLMGAYPSPEANAAESDDSAGGSRSGG